MFRFPCRQSFLGNRGASGCTRPHLRSPWALLEAPAFRLVVGIGFIFASLPADAGPSSTDADQATSRGGAASGGLHDAIGGPRDEPILLARNDGHGKERSEKSTHRDKKGGDKKGKRDGRGKNHDKDGKDKDRDVASDDRPGRSRSDPDRPGRDRPGGEGPGAGPSAPGPSSPGPSSPVRAWHQSVRHGAWRPAGPGRIVRRVRPGHRAERREPQRSAFLADAEHHAP